MALPRSALLRKPSRSDASTLEERSTFASLAVAGAEFLGNGVAGAAAECSCGAAASRQSGIANRADFMRRTEPRVRTQWIQLAKLPICVARGRVAGPVQPIT